MNKLNEKGFTLVEILAVIFILSLVITVVVTRGFGAFSDTKDSINKEQERLVEEAAKVVGLDIKHCIDDDTAMIDELESLIVGYNPDTVCGTGSDYIGDCECLQKYLETGITIDYDEFKESGYLTGFSADNYIVESSIEIQSNSGINDEINVSAIELKPAPKDPSGSILYVNSSSGSDSNSGTSSSEELGTLKSAIEAAGGNEYTIIVGSDEVITDNLVIPENITLKSSDSTEKKLIYNFDFTSSTQEMTLRSGKYLLEVWGAQGGGDSGWHTYKNVVSKGGKGGYSKGTLTLTNSINIYIEVGGQGGTISSASSAIATQIAAGGYNGGGSAELYGLNGGGGATDIRLSTNSLYARVIVAGGGGGGGNSRSSTLTSDGGYGGGRIGGTPINQFDNRVPGKGGTQTGITVSSSSTTNAAFGIGAGGKVTNLRGGGGAGWYGGTQGANSTGGGGGSGYVYTESTADDYPSGCLLNPDYYLTNAETIGGDQTFLSPNGESEIGHQGNGYARITMLIS